MSIAKLVRDMGAAGASYEAIALAIEAVEGVRGEIDARRLNDRDRKRKQRSRDSHVTVTGPSEDISLSKEVPPAPLQETQTLMPPSPPMGAHGSIRQAGFSQFWLAFPRKVGKGAARKAFDRAWLKIDAPDPLAVMLAALAAVKPTWTDPNFIPHPATWLNEERWEDGEMPVVPRVLSPDERAEETARQAAQQRWAEDFAEKQIQAGKYV